MTLTIVIACLNENPVTLANTVRSIRETSGGKAQIVIVDDCSITPVEHMLAELKGTDLRVITNLYRCGVGPSRHIGVLAATTDWVGIMDGHMLCVPGWFPALTQKVDYECARLMHVRDCGKTIYCGTCLAIDSKHMDPANPVAVYQGGSLNILGPDKAKPDEMQVMEGIWHPPPVEDGAEIPCCMGACYFMSRDWFLQLNPLQYLRSWGSDETFLSVKSWLAGGDVRYAKDIRIAHKFLIKGERQGFRAEPGHVTWNKLFAVHTLCPARMHGPLLDALKKQTEPGEWRVANEMLRRDWHIVATEQAYNRRDFERDLYWLADKFSLPVPR